MSEKHVLIVDDEELYRELLCGRLGRQGYRVSEAADGEAALALVARDRPDVVVLDVAMPGLDGIATAKALRELMPAPLVVALSAHTDPAQVCAMLDAGAHGYVAKQAAFDELLVALRVIRRGTMYVSPAIGLPRDMPCAGRRLLSAREREVARLVAEGLTSKEIGDELGCAVKTVETHRKQIMDKLGLRSVAALTKWAVRVGLTPPH